MVEQDNTNYLGYLTKICKQEDLSKKPNLVTLLEVYPNHYFGVFSIVYLVVIVYNTKVSLHGYGTLNQSAFLSRSRFLSVRASSSASNTSVKVRIAQRPHMTKTVMRT